MLLYGKALSEEIIDGCDNNFSEKLLIQEDPGLYFFINQGCLTVDNMDDKEEMDLVDVSHSHRFIYLPHVHSIVIVTNRKGLECWGSWTKRR